jgi:4-amino-4-deoxy-L-arabinose transferase-like glycosyltransferase
LILLFVGLPILALSIADRQVRWLRGLRPLVGALWFCALALPWFIAIAMQSGGDFFADAIGRELLSGIAATGDTRAFPPGYYLVFFWIMFWPGAVLVGLAALPIWRLREEPGVRFLLAWIIPAWIVFEIFISKAPHYVLPLYPAIAILVAYAVERKALLETRWLKAGTIAWFLIPTIIFILCVVLIVKAGKPVGFLSWPIAVAAATLGLFAWRLYSRDEAERSALKGIAAGLLVAIAFYGVVVPAIERLSPSPAIARALRDLPCDEPRLASAGFYEPSLVFSTRTDTLLTDGAGAAEFLRQGPCRIVAVERRQLQNFLQRADSSGVRYDAIGRIEGLNPGRARRVMISMFRSRQ